MDKTWLAMVRGSILKAFVKYPVKHTEDDVAKIVARVVKAKPEFPKKFAFVVARNWSIDQSRRARCAAKREVEIQTRTETLRIKRERFVRARDEFNRIVETLTPRIRETQLRQLGMIRLRFFEGVSDEECASRFPGSKRDQRYQWQHRGMKLIVPHASPELLAEFDRHVRTATKSV